MIDSPPDLPVQINNPNHRVYRRFLVPLALVAFSLVTSLICQRLGILSGTGGPYVLFSAAVVVSAVLSGFCAGVMATILSVLATGYFHLDPLYSLSVDNADEAALLVLFLFEGLVLSAAAPAISCGVGLASYGYSIRYGSAIAIVGCAVLLKLLLAPSLAPETVPFMLFYATVMVVAWAGGPGPGMLATILSAACVAFLFFEPHYDLRVHDPHRAGQLMLFLFEGGLISCSSQALIQMRNRATAGEVAAKRYWQELQLSENRLRKQNQVLVDLARPSRAMDTFDENLRLLTEVTAKTLEVERVSIWLYDAVLRTLQCRNLYERSECRHSSGQILPVDNFPRYFQAIEQDRAVAAHDAMKDPRTSEFAKSYLMPLGISSLLDAPIRTRNGVAGVVCVEHIGNPRRWVIEEEQFVASIADHAAINLKREELRLADRKIRSQAALLDQARDAIIAVDAIGTIQYWNRSAENLYGWKEAEVLQKGISQFLTGCPPEYLPVESAIVAKGEWAGELIQRRKDGREMEVAIRWTSLLAERDSPARLLIASDVTERKILERKLERSQRMESLGALTSGIAHDMNNMLTPVLVGVELLDSAGSASMRDSLIHTIRGSAERAAALLKQILSFAKGASQEQGPVSIGPIIEQIVELLRHSFPRTIQFQTRFPEDLGLVRGPTSKLDQVLMNLCVNARDAMPNGGTLTIEAENHHNPDSFVDIAPGSYIRLRVSDTGTGIPAEIVSRIFDPFFTTKEPGKGTGLGLATTREIINSMGGIIHVQSQSGVGSRFEIYLPVVSDIPVAIKPDSKEMPVGFSELILVVDDESSICELASRILEAYGYRVLLASNAVEAMFKTRDNRNELRAVLLDMNIPGVPVEVTMAEFKAIAPGIPVILSTGNGGEAADQPGIGETAFIAKPYTAAQLLQCIRKVLDATRA